MQKRIEQHISSHKNGSYELEWFGYNLQIFKYAWGELVISLDGGQVLLFRPVGEKPLLWLTDKPVAAPGAIRGGVPVCWPWFAEHAEDPALPKHGVARTARWCIDLEEIDDVSGRWVLIPKQPLWDGLVLQLEITVVDSELALALTTENCSAQAVAITQALHSYVAVSNISQIELHGLEGLSYRDKLQDMQESLQQGVLQFSAETDSIYSHKEADAGVLIVDHGWQRVIEINKQGSGSTVVWNPGEAAAAISDVGMDQVMRYICVEAARTRFYDDQLLAAGEALTMATSFRVLPYPSGA